MVHEDDGLWDGALQLCSSFSYDADGCSSNTVAFGCSYILTLFLCPLKSRHMLFLLLSVL